MILTSDQKSLMQAVRKAIQDRDHKERVRILKVLAQHRITAKIKFGKNQTTLEWVYAIDLDNQLFDCPRAAYDPTPGVVGVVQVFARDGSILAKMQVFEVNGKLEVRTSSGEVVDIPNKKLLKYALKTGAMAKITHNRSK